MKDLTRGKVIDGKNYKCCRNSVNRGKDLLGTESLWGHSFTEKV